MFPIAFTAGLAVAVIAVALYTARALWNLGKSASLHPGRLRRPITAWATVVTVFLIFTVVVALNHGSRHARITNVGVTSLLSNLIDTCQWANGDECAPLRGDPNVLPCIAASSNVWALDSCPALAAFAKSGIATPHGVYDAERDPNTGEPSHRLVGTSWTVAPNYRQYLAHSPDPALLVVTGTPRVERATISRESPTAVLVKWTVDFIPSPIAHYDIGGNANAIQGSHSYYSEFRWDGSQWSYVAPFVPGQQLADRYAWSNESFLEKIQSVAAGLFMIVLLPFAALLYLLSQHRSGSWKGPKISTGFHAEE